jgi:hypothetical protein
MSPSVFHGNRPQLTWHELPMQQTDLRSLLLMDYSRLQKKGGAKIRFASPNLVSRHAILAWQTQLFTFLRSLARQDYSLTLFFRLATERRAG